MMFSLFDEEGFILYEDQGKGRFLLYCFLTTSSLMSGLVFLNLHWGFLLANLTTYETYWPFGDWQLSYCSFKQLPRETGMSNLHAICAVNIKLDMR